MFKKPQLLIPHGTVKNSTALAAPKNLIDREKFINKGVEARNTDMFFCNIKEAPYSSASSSNSVNSILSKGNRDRNF